MIDIISYINREIHCPCGRNHFSSVKIIDINKDAILRLTTHIQNLGFRKVFLITDPNIWKAAGEQTASRLIEAGLLKEKIILDYDDVIPDERVIDEIIQTFPLDADLVLAVGSGTINDLCKFVSSRMKVSYMIFVSAPSMDGFASNGAALILRHNKTTVNCHGPVAVIGDTGILSQAPMRLIAAGMGDTLGKYTCLLDWKISHLINNEYYCEQVVQMVKTALTAVIEQHNFILQRDPASIKSLTEALILTGIAMSFTGNSRPASGCEHHLSHFWEMKSIMTGRKPALHGAQVGIGSILSIRLYHKLCRITPDFEYAKLRVYDKEQWIRKMRFFYGPAAEGIIQLEEQSHKNDTDARNKRLGVLQLKWPEIRNLIRSSLPQTEDMEKLLWSFNTPINPIQIDITSEEVKQAVIAAKEIRNRYTLLQLLWDLGLTDEFAEDTKQYFDNGQRFFFLKNK